MHNFTAVTDVCSQLTILHFSRILPLPHLSLLHMQLKVWLAVSPAVLGDFRPIFGQLTLLSS